MSLPRESAIFEIPTVGRLLLRYRELVERPTADELPISNEEIPAELSTYLSRLRSLASALDGPGPQKLEATPSGTSDLDRLSVWLENAIRCARAGLTHAEVKIAPPYEVINALPVPRWVERITALVEELSQNGTLSSLLGDFRASFASGATAEKPALCGRNGGMDLWYAINSYRLSLYQQTPKERDLVIQIRRLETIISNADNDSVVRSLAEAFQFLNYYRLDRRSMLDTTLFSSWPPLLGPLRATLDALRAERAGEPVEVVWPQFGVGLADISPAAQDWELERRVRRPGSGTTQLF
jgi:hypothetical protein